MNNVRNLCDAVPLDFGDQKNVEQLKQMSQVRLHVASQWARIIHEGSLRGEKSAVFKNKVEVMISSTNKIIREFAQVIPFCPDPISLKDHQDGSDQGQEAKSSSPSSSIVSPLSGSSLDTNDIPFEMKFMQCEDADVWTVLQVSEHRLMISLVK